MFSVLIFLLIFMATESKLFSAKMACDEAESKEMVWNKPSQSCYLYELCPVYLTIQGVVEESQQKGINDSFIFQLHIQPILTRRASFDIIRLSQLSLNVIQDNLNKSKIYLGKLLLPAISFCGQLFFKTTIKFTHKFVVFKKKTLDLPIHALCREEENIDLKIKSNLSPLQVLTPVWLNNSRAQLVFDKDLEFWLVNQGETVVKERCGLYSLQIITFLVPAERNHSNDFIVVQKKYTIFNALQSIANSYSNLMIENNTIKCSPSIPPKTEVKLNVQPLDFDKNDLQQSLELILIIDPLDIEHFPIPLYERLFSFKIKLRLTTETAKLSEKCKVYGSFDRAIVNYQKLNQNVFFQYNINSRDLRLLSNQSVAQIELNQHFYSQWIIQIMSDILLTEPFKCYKLSYTVIDLFYQLVAEVSKLFYQSKTQSPEEQDCLKQFFLIINTVAENIFEITSGDIGSIYFPLLVKFFQDLTTNSKHYSEITKSDQNIWTTIQNIMTDIAYSQPPRLATTKAIPKRIILFLQRVLNNTLQVGETIPPLVLKPQYVKNLRLLFKMISKNKLWTAQLPSDIVSKFVEVFNADTLDNIRQIVNDLDQLLITKQLEYNDTSNFLLRLLNDSTYTKIWKMWIRIKVKWHKELIQTKWILMEGVPDFKVTQRGYCLQKSYQTLSFFNMFPDFLLPENSTKKRPHLYLIHLLYTYFKSSPSGVYRGDRDKITGLIFFSKIMLCNGTTELTNKCSRGNEDA